MKVKRRGDDQKFLAEVLAVGTECDIALLTVADPAFWEGVTPLVFGALPRLQDGVAVVGYPCAAPSMSTLSAQCVKHLVTAHYSRRTVVLSQAAACYPLFATSLLSHYALASHFCSIREQNGQYRGP